MLHQSSSRTWRKKGKEKVLRLLLEMVQKERFWGNGQTKHQEGQSAKAERAEGEPPAEALSLTEPGSGFSQPLSEPHPWALSSGLHTLILARMQLWQSRENPQPSVSEHS